MINIYLEAVQGEGTPAAQVQPPQPGTDPVVRGCSCVGDVMAGVKLWIVGRLTD